MSIPNPAVLMRLFRIKNQFESRHPKVISFGRALLAQGVPVGTVLEITVTAPDGKKLCTNMRVQEEDVAALQEIGCLRNDLSNSQEN